MTFFFYRR